MDYMIPIRKNVHMSRDNNLPPDTSVQILARGSSQSDDDRAGWCNISALDQGLEGSCWNLALVTVCPR